MNLIRKNKTKGILAIGILMLSLSLQLAAGATDHRTNKTYKINNSLSVIPEKYFDNKPRQYESSFAISPDEVLYKLRQKQTLTLVDVRNSEDFERLHVRASLNIPLYAVKSKAFLKSFPLVLINEGFQYSLLENECRRLKDGGFKVLILDGGIAGWAEQGNVLVGDIFALEELHMISPQEFFRERDSENILAIDIAPVQSEFSQQLMPYSKHLPITSEPAEWARKLDRIIAGHQNQPFLSILVFDETGDGYDRARKLCAGRHVNVFFLQSGIAGYKRYLENLELSWTPRDSRIKTNKPCKICGEEIEESVMTETSD